MPLRFEDEVSQHHTRDKEHTTATLTRLQDRLGELRNEQADNKENSTEVSLDTIDVTLNKIQQLLDTDHAQFAGTIYHPEGLNCTIHFCFDPQINEIIAIFEQQEKKTSGAHKKVYVEGGVRFDVPSTHPHRLYARAIIKKRKSRGVQRELKAGIAFDSPYIVKAVTSGQDDSGRHHIFTPRADMTLKDQHQQPYIKRLITYYTILLGLKHFHEKAVHQDIKPENIFLYNGSAVIGDFGLSTLVSDDISGGTFCFVSPELFASINFKKVDSPYCPPGKHFMEGRSKYQEPKPEQDLWAVGIIIFKKECNLSYESLETPSEWYPHYKKFIKDHPLGGLIIADEDKRLTNIDEALEILRKEIVLEKSAEEFIKKLEKINNSVGAKEIIRLLEQQNQQGKSMQEVSDEIFTIAREKFDADVNNALDILRETIVPENLAKALIKNLEGTNSSGTQEIVKILKEQRGKDEPIQKAFYKIFAIAQKKVDQEAEGELSMAHSWSTSQFVFFGHHKRGRHENVGWLYDKISDSKLSGDEIPELTREISGKSFTHSR